jgi:hypothetical protein
MRHGWSKPTEWPEKERQHLRRLYPLHSVAEVARILGRKTSCVKAAAQRYNTQRVFRWTSAEVTKLIEFYPDTRTEQLATVLGRTVSSIHAKAKKLDIQKSPAFVAMLDKEEGERLKKCGRGNRFPKGHVPANKGLRRPGFSLSHGRMSSTTFKKGNRPRNYLPIGTVKANADGYLRIKIADDRPGVGAVSQNWEFIHVRVWEDAHGSIPKGHRIWWKDRNHENCALENLELLSDAEHMARTTIHKLPTQLKDTIQLAGRLKRRIRKYEKQIERSAQSPVRNDRSAKGRG